MAHCIEHTHAHHNALRRRALVFFFMHAWQKETNGFAAVQALNYNFRLAPTLRRLTARSPQKIEMCFSRWVRIKFSFRSCQMMKDLAIASAVDQPIRDCFEQVAEQTAVPCKFSSRVKPLGWRLLTLTKNNHFFKQTLKCYLPLMDSMCKP